MENKKKVLGRLVTVTVTQASGLTRGGNNYLVTIVPVTLTSDGYRLNKKELIRRDMIWVTYGRKQDKETREVLKQKIVQARERAERINCGQDLFYSAF